MLFLFSLAFSLLMTATLIALLCRSLGVNWDRKNRRPLSYLTPVLLTVVLLYLSITQTLPRLLDTVAVIAKTCTVEEVNIQAADIHWNVLQNGARKFYYNQRQYTLTAGRTYRISYTPRSHYIIEVTEVAETATRD